MNKYTGIGQLNTSAILSIHKPEKCPTLNNIGIQVIAKLKICANH